MKSDEFYCGSCGKFKSIELQCARPAGKTKICKSCAEKAKKRSSLSDKRRDYIRSKSTKRFDEIIKFVETKE